MLDKSSWYTVGQNWLLLARSTALLLVLDRILGSVVLHRSHVCLRLRGTVASCTFVNIVCRSRPPLAPCTLFRFSGGCAILYQNHK